MFPLLHLQVIIKKLKKTAEFSTFFKHTLIFILFQITACYYRLLYHAAYPFETASDLKQSFGKFPIFRLCKNSLLYKVEVSFTAFTMIQLL